MKLDIINPKAMNINQLFGHTNPLTNEWTDGIVSQIVNDFLQSPESKYNWMLFDGPADASWVENINTVLDENRMLCLANGQRLKLPTDFSVFFELDNLDQTTPATVTRCGMIYVDDSTLNW